MTDTAEEVTAAPPQSSSGNVLEVRDLRTHFATRAGTVRAVDGVSFDVPTGKTLGIVGESGSGKSVTALSVMRLIEPPGRIVGGKIIFQGRDIAAIDEEAMRWLRGQQISIVFQDPLTALNPVYRVGEQIAEAIIQHQSLGRHEVRERVVDLIRAVGIPDPERRVNDYPHSLSGGMRQRITIAMAIANEPALLILDEPTTALDVTIQAQILELISKLSGVSVMLVTHDIGVVRDVCDHVVVMYGGRVMETGPARAVTGTPRHPYTLSLIDAIPGRNMRGKRLHAIAGTVPSPLEMPPGCPFSTRCPRATETCDSAPPMASLGEGRAASCWHL
ncbi:MAG: ABC transporter ATP-binding protein [Devosia sp.]